MKLTPYEAAKEAAAALAAAPAGTAGPVRIESRRVDMPATFGDAILTTIRPGGPGADVKAAARIVSQLPGVLAWSTGRNAAMIYRSRERAK